jgi:hypothetical protein
MTIALMGLIGWSTGYYGTGWVIGRLARRSKGRVDEC